MRCHSATKIRAEKTRTEELNRDSRRLPDEVPFRHKDTGGRGLLFKSIKSRMESQGHTIVVQGRQVAENLRVRQMDAERLRLLSEVRGVAEGLTDVMAQPDEVIDIIALMATTPQATVVIEGHHQLRGVHAVRLLKGALQGDEVEGSPGELEGAKVIHNQLIGLQEGGHSEGNDSIPNMNGIGRQIDVEILAHMEDMLTGMPGLVKRLIQFLSEHLNELRDHMGGSRNLQKRIRDGQMIHSKFPPKDLYSCTQDTEMMCWGQNLYPM